MPIPGTKRRVSLEENLGAVNVVLTVDDRAPLDEAISRGAAADDRYNASAMRELNR